MTKLVNQLVTAMWLLWDGLKNPHYLKRLLTPAHRERGSVTIENVIWAVAVIGIAAIVTGAIIRYVTAKADEIHD
jgi:hypothetical protein